MSDEGMPPFERLAPSAAPWQTVRGQRARPTPLRRLANMRPRARTYLYGQIAHTYPGTKHMTLESSVTKCCSFPMLAIDAAVPQHISVVVLVMMMAMLLLPLLLLTMMIRSNDAKTGRGLKTKFDDRDACCTSNRKRDKRTCR